MMPSHSTVYFAVFACLLFATAHGRQDMAGINMPGESMPTLQGGTAEAVTCNACAMILHDVHYRVTVTCLHTSG